MTRIKEDGVRVEGLNETIAALKALGVGAEVAIRLANKEAATFVAAHAKGAAEALGGVAAHVAPSIKATAGVKSGSVGFGGGDYPMGAGAEFGGGARPTTLQFAPWRGTTGYFLFPTIRRDSPAVDAAYRTALEAIIHKAGL